MKREIRFLALLLVIFCVFSMFSGCKKSTTASGGDESGISSLSPDDVLMDDVDVDISGNASDAQAGTSTSAGGSTAGSKGASGITQVDNDALFKNIPKELKGTTVTIAHWGDEGAAEYVKVQKAFTKLTGISVKWVQYAESGYISKVASQIAAKQGPDIVICNGTFPAALEVVQELPSYFNINDGFWDKRVCEALSANGKYYFVNSYSSPFTGGTVVYYNKKIFADNGLTSPEDYVKAGKWTYENLTKCLEDVTKVGKHGGMLESMVLAEQMGASMISYNPKTGKFSGDATNADLISTLQWNAECNEKGLAGGYGISGFASGQLGICMAGTYGLKYNGYFKDMAPSEIGVVQLPTSFKGKKLNYMPLGTRGYGIAKSARNPEGAYYFLRYFLDYEKYGPAGAQIFSNKVMEKYFVVTQLPTFRNANLRFEYYKDALAMIGKGWSSDTDWGNVRHSASGQVAVEMAKMSNVCTNAVNEANSKLMAFTK